MFLIYFPGGHNSHRGFYYELHEFYELLGNQGDRSMIAHFERITRPVPLIARVSQNESRVNPCLKILVNPRQGFAGRVDSNTFADGNYT